MTKKTLVAPNPQSLHDSLEASIRGPLAMGDLNGLCTARFLFPSRPNQEAICRAAIEGWDVLLVVPTGSGKSLCRP